jgi:hypothetical protein
MLQYIRKKQLLTDNNPLTMLKSSLFLIATLAQLTLISQEELSFPINSRFFDIPGSTFLSVRQIGPKTIVAEHSDDGEVIWNDSILFPFEETDTLIWFKDAKRFGNTDNYLLSVYQQILPVNLPPTNGTSLHLAIKISLSSQSIVDTVTTLLPGIYNFTTEKNDSTISILSLRFIPQGSRGYEVYDISENLEVEFISPYDSIFPYANYRAPVFDYIGNELYYYWDSETGIGLSKFDENMSNIGEVGYEFTGPYEYHYPPIVHYGDSIFIFQQGTEMLYRCYWMLAWVEKDLNPIHSTGIYPINFNASLTSTLFYNYEVQNYDRVQIDDNFIYVLASLNNPYKDSLTIFSYDYNFNEACLLKLERRFTPDVSLVKINNKVYFRKAGVDGFYDYFLVNGCQFNYLSTDDVERSDIFVYPNPSTNVFNIQNSKNKLLHVRALNVQGQEVMSYKSSNSIIPMNFENHSTGMYLLEITSGDERVLHKIIKQ